MNKKILKLAFVLAWAFVVPAFVFSVSSLWQNMAYASTTPPVLSPTDQAAEAAKKAEVKKYNDKLNKALKQKAALEANLGQIQQNVAVKQSVITNTKAVISDTAATIADKQLQIQAASDRLTLQQEILKDLLQQIYVAKTEPAVGIVLAGTEFSQVFGNVDNLETLEDRLVSVSNDIADSKNQISSETDQLAAIKQSKEQVLGATVAQQQNLLANQSDVQDQIQEQDATIAQIQAKLDKLNSDLSSLLGVVVSTDNVKKAAQEASDATGVRASFILGELMQESGAGHYTGGCTYKNANMHAYDIPVFKKIMASLGYGLNDKKVSCPARGRNGNIIGSGGAMGISQFIPSTWSGYINRIAAATGDNPPNPWNVTDGVLGMAIKLKAAGADSKKGEYAASMIYYCGTAHPSNPTIKKLANQYAADVQSLASGYENND